MGLDLFVLRWRSRASDCSIQSDRIPSDTVIRQPVIFVPKYMDKSGRDEISVASLYYDGNCPLCNSEMARLEKLKSGDLRLVDIHALDAGSDRPDKDTLLRTLHLRLPDGRWLTGADANVAAWQFTHRGVWFRWLRWPVLRRLVDFVYELWARRRYNRLYSKGCAIGEHR